VIDDQFAVFDVVTQRRHTAHPHALLLGGCDFVAQWGKKPLAFNLSGTSKKKCGGRESVKAKIARLK
jgi:hypothetical protein